jgi:hypothetical protein
MHYFISPKQTALFRPERVILPEQDWVVVEHLPEFKMLGLHDDARHDHYGKPLVYETAAQAPSLTHWKLNEAQWQRYALRNRLPGHELFLLDEIIAGLRRQAWVATGQQRLDYEWRRQVEAYEQQQAAAAERRQQSLLAFHAEAFPSRRPRPGRPAPVYAQSSLF